MTIAITGATGFVGQAVIKVLRHRGHRVRALARKLPVHREDVDWVGGDLGDRRALNRLCESVEAVIHIAGLTTSRNLDDFQDANVKGTLELVEAAAQAKVPRFIFTSSLAAREPRLSAYGGSKAKAEKIVQSSALDWTIVRPPAVYGPNDKDMLDLFKGAEWGVVPMPPPGSASLIYVYDLAELLVALIPSGEAVTHQIFEPDDGKPSGWTHRELAQTIGWAVGTRPYVPHLSRKWLKRFAKLDGMLRGDKSKLTVDRACYMTHPDWVASSDRSVPKDVWYPRLATRDGMKMTANWYKKHGWL